MKKLLIIVISILFVVCISGCAKENEQVDYTKAPYKTKILNESLLYFDTKDDCIIPNFALKEGDKFTVYETKQIDNVLWCGIGTNLWIRVDNTEIFQKLSDDYDLRIIKNRIYNLHQNSELLGNIQSYFDGVELQELRDYSDEIECEFNDSNNLIIEKIINYDEWNNNEKQYYLINYDYDENGNMIKFTFNKYVNESKYYANDAVINYEYDSNNRIIKENDDLLIYDDDGNLIIIERGNGQNHLFEYNGNICYSFIENAGLTYLWLLRYNDAGERIELVYYTNDPK